MAAEERYLTCTICDVVTGANADGTDPVTAATIIPTTTGLLCIRCGANLPLKQHPSAPVESTPAPAPWFSPAWSTSVLPQHQNSIGLAQGSSPPMPRSMSFPLSGGPDIRQTARELRRSQAFAFAGPTGSASSTIPLHVLHSTATPENTTTFLEIPLIIGAYDAGPPNIQTILTNEMLLGLARPSSTRRLVEG